MEHDIKKEIGRWIPIDPDNPEFPLPKCGEKVLIKHDKKFPITTITIGFHCNRLSFEAPLELDEEHCEYCEETDKYYVTEGWYSQCSESEWFYELDMPLEWMPLPD